MVSGVSNPSRRLPRWSNHEGATCRMLKCVHPDASYIGVGIDIALDRTGGLLADMVGILRRVRVRRPDKRLP